MLHILTDGELYWLVRDNDGALEVLGFVKLEQYGAAVIGGPSGSHCTGHGESWQTKWEEIMGQGFVEQNHAKARNLLPPGWKPPRVKRRDRKLIESFKPTRT